MFEKQLIPATEENGHTRTLSDIERDAIVHAVKMYASAREAARRLGIGRSTLYRKMHEYKISTPASRLNGSK